MGHLHLAVNHIPFIGFVFGLAVLIAGMKKESEDLKSAAIWTFIVVAVFALVTFFTGEPAEDMVKDLQGGKLGPTEKFVEAHETAGLFFLIISVLAGLISAFIMVLKGKGKTINPSLFKLLLVIAILGALVGARTSQLGGQVRHTEIRTASLGSVAEAFEEGLNARDAEESGMPDPRNSSK